ncbi:MAG: SusC/RagA family TonB-linked outer membrane protein, partial [Paraprevotella sp.]|nr:SusC/RagA family TonB-linked outer membrane protein [Paraprevotella sp.]
LWTSIGLMKAQTQKVTGTVLSEEDGQPIVGASVVVKGTTIGVQTDIDGKFVLSNLPSSAKTLSVSYVGMQTQDVEVKPEVDVLLKVKSLNINEVVVTGYSTQRKASFTGAASIVGENVVNKNNDVNFVKALDGTVTGVQINTSTGMPGSAGTVYIRGRGSIDSGTQPLYVIDGMPVNSDYYSSSTNSSLNNWIDPMTSINPADIESITVLKDAAATAIYGARAANVVIVITTKKGAEGKFNLNLDVKQGFVSMGNNNMKFANAQQTMNLLTDGMTASQGGIWDDNYNYLKKYYNWDGTSSTDWIDAITRKGYYQDYNLSAQGHIGNTGYYMSLGYINTKGLVINSDMERFSGRLNLDSKFKWVTLGANTSYSYAVKDGFPEATTGEFASPIVGAISCMNPMYPVYDEDGNYANLSLFNPLAVNDKNLGDMDRTRMYTVNLDPYLQIDFGKGIYAKTTLGVNLNNVEEYRYMGAIYNPEGMDYNGKGILSTTRDTEVTWNNIVGWKYRFADKHDVSVMLGQEMEKKYLRGNEITKSDFSFAASGERELTTAGTDMGTTETEQEARLASYFMDLHYAYMDKYYLSGSFRRDGSSAF